MNNSATASRVKVSADDRGVVSHAGMCMLCELADQTGLSTQGIAALADTYRGPWVYAPGDVFADLPAAVADGAAPAGLPRPGNAGPNTAADPITVVRQALASPPPQHRPRPLRPGRTDGGGAPGHHRGHP